MTLLFAAAVALASIDAATGLPMNDGWETVRAHCGACHSHAVVRQQRGKAAFWQATIDRMQSQHGLWRFDAPTRTAIVDYLSTTFAVEADDVRVRRLPLVLRENP